MVGLLSNTYLDRNQGGPHAHHSSIHIDQLRAEADEVIVVFIDDIHQLRPCTSCDIIFNGRFFASFIVRQLTLFFNVDKYASSC